MNTEKIITIIVTALIIGLVLYFIIYWFGGQRELDNAKDDVYIWTQNAIVMEKTNHWWGDSCLLDAEDGKRYYEDYCHKYVNGDKVIIEMYQDRHRWINGIFDANIEVKP